VQKFFWKTENSLFFLNFTQISRFLIPPAHGLAAEFVVHEKVPQGIYRVVVQPVLQRQFRTAAGFSFRITIAMHRLYQPLASR
jgi:hypothetical protein